jgi:hypothetical protein
MNAPPTDNPLRANPVFWLIWGLLGAAVIGSFVTLGLALRSADRQLPESYHWEGEHLDRDFARARVAADHGIEASFSVAHGQCRITLRQAPGDPQALNLLFANTADPGLDRALRLPRLQAGEYGAACATPPEGRWFVSLEDDAGQWSIRTQVEGNLSLLDLRARHPDGNKDGGS